MRITMSMFLELKAPEGYRLTRYDSNLLLIYSKAHDAERVSGKSDHVAQIHWQVGAHGKEYYAGFIYGKRSLQHTYHDDLSELIVALCTQHRMQIK